MLHHQSWLTDEALRNRGLFTPPKEFPQRLGDFFGKDLYTAHLQHTANLTSELNMNDSSTTTTAASAATTLKAQQQQQYKTNSFNVRYPSMAAFFQHQHQQLQQQQQQQATTIPKQNEQHKKQQRQNTPSPHQLNTTGTSNTTTTLLGNANKIASPISISPVMKHGSGCDLLLEELQRKSDANAERESGAIELSSPNLDKNHNNSNVNNNNNKNIINNNNNNNSIVIDNNNKNLTFTNSGNLMSPSHSGILYKESLDQFLQRRRSSSASLLVGENLRNYSQLLLSSSANTPSCTDTSSCKEKSSSSSTSSTPPPTSALLSQHQHLSQMLKSPSESSLFGEVIEEETRCVVCNAHFPNVWLLEQHAALQHPHIGPGDEKPFICEQCGQSYRYRSAYAKHKEQNHRARLPADKLFTCDVCGMQFRYLKSFKKHRLNHALERLHGKKSLVSNSGNMKHPATATFGEQDIVTSSQEAMSADDGVIEDLRIKIKRERDQRDDEEERDEEQDNTIDSAGINMIYNDNSSASASTSATESNITSTDVIYSTNKKHRLLTHSETDPSYHCLQQVQQTLPPLPPQTHLHAGILNTGPHQIPVPMSVGVAPSAQHLTHSHSAATATAASLSSLNSLSSITSLINADRIPSEQFLGLNPQEASILNFLRVDAAERQRDKRPQASRFACPFCGKCVRSKENLKLHVRKHTGERPFVCLFCGRAFGGKSDLTRHLRIHTGERPYHCESCGKCFARADYLSKHLTTHIHNAPR